MRQTLLFLHRGRSKSWPGCQHLRMARYVSLRARGTDFDPTELRLCLGTVVKISMLSTGRNGHMESCQHERLQHGSSQLSCKYIIIADTYAQPLEF